jgi:hypothetical protein
MEKRAQASKCLHSGLQKSERFTMPRNYGAVFILTEKIDAEWFCDASHETWFCDESCSILKISFALPSCCASGAS